MKLLLAFIFIAFLGSTAALPAHKEDPKLNLVHFANMKKNSVSQGKSAPNTSNFCNNIVYIQYWLHVSLPIYTESDACLTRLYVMALTSGVDDAGSDMSHIVEVQAAGQV